MKQHVSISRLHKLADRLKAKITELNAEATTKLGLALWRQGVVTEAQVNRAVAQSQLGLTAMHDAERLSRVLSDIRTTIAVQNERLGINAKLALQDALNRQLAVMKSVVAGSDTMLLDEVAVGQATGDYGLSVANLSAAQVEALKADIARLQREVFGLSDEVAEANATRVELELADDVAALITG